MNKNIAFSVIIVFLCAMLLFIFSFKKKSAAYSAAEYGMKANDIDFAKQNTKILTKIIKKSRFNKATKISFSEGKYYFCNFKGYFNLNNKKNISFVGNNSEFINTSYDNTLKKYSECSGFFKLCNCKNISFSGISFDYLNYCSIYGTIVNVEYDKLEIKLAKEYTDGKEHLPVSGGETALAVNEISAEDSGSIISDTYFSNVPKTEFDKKTMIYTISGMQLTGSAVGSYQIGNSAVVRFSINKFAAPAFLLQNVSNFKLKNVNIYSCPSAAIYSISNSKNCTFDNLKIMPKSNSELKFSSNVDGIHLKNQSGFVNLTNCSFVGMGDDSLNVNSKALKVLNHNKNHLTVTDAYQPEATIQKTWAKKGDTLRFYDSSWKLVGTAKVKSFNGSKLKINKSINGLDRLIYIQNTRYIPKISIYNTLVDCTRARAFIIRSENVSVTNCNIKNTALAGIIVAADVSYWYEMGPSKNVEIKNNKFYNCCTENSNANYGVISIKGCDDSGGESFNAGVHKNINIIGNTIEKSGSSAIYASATDNLKILDNIFLNNSLKPIDNILTSAFPVSVINCNKVEYNGNENNDYLYTKNSHFIND